MKNSALIYEEFYEGAQMLPKDQRADAYDAYCRWVLYGEEYSGDNLAIKVLLRSVSKKVEKANSNYQKKVDAMQKVNDRTTSHDNVRHRTTTHDQAPVTVTDIVTDNVSVNDTVTVSEKKDKRKAAASASVPKDKKTYSDDPELDKAIKDFIENRKKLRKPMTDRAIELFLKHLEKLAPGDHARQRQMLDTAVERGWLTVYPPKAENANQTRSSPSGWQSHSDMLNEEFDRIINGHENDSGGVEF